MSGWKSWMVIVYMLCSVQFALAQQAPDTILYNGKVLTVDRNFSVAEAVAVRDGKIATVGRSDDVLKLAGPNTLRVDLKGKTVVPGLINTHVHVSQAAERDYGGELTTQQQHQYPINWRIVKTKDDVLKQIRDIITAFKFKPGEWIYLSAGGPKSEHVKIMLDDLNRWELDKAAPNNPIVMSLGLPAPNGNLVNSKAIEVLWSRYGDHIERYGRYWIDASGRPDGHLEPPASRLVNEFLPNPMPEALSGIYRKVLEEFSAIGVTTISTRLPDYSINTYKILDSTGELPVRIACGVQSVFEIPGKSMAGIQMGSGSDRVWITSVTPAGVDGSGSRMCIDIRRDAQAAATVEQTEGGVSGLSAGANWWPRGQCHMDIEYNGGARGARIKANYFAEFPNRVAEDGLRMANYHIAGDGAHSRLLTELEKIDRAKPGAVKGWAMDHCRLIDPKDIPRAAKLGLMWSCDPAEGGGPEVTARAFSDQVAHTYVAPIKSMLDAGINVSVEGEWPEIERFITRKDGKGKVWGPDQRVDRATALRIATYGGAVYVLKPDKLGSIEPGKLADLVIIDKDYMTVPEDQISEIRSLMTMLGGRIIFVHSAFAEEYNLRPEGAVVGTYEELVKRRKRFDSSRS